MALALRRHYRGVKIAKRLRILRYYDWYREHVWITEPGRLDKFNTSCTCLMCRSCRKNGRMCHNDYRKQQIDMEEHDHYLRKRNRVYRSLATPSFARRGGFPGTAVPKDGPDIRREDNFEERLAKLRAARA